MNIKKISGHEHAQVKVYVYPDNARKLVSYSTIVCELDGDGWLTVNGLYSRTTIKHIGWFMRELANDFNVNISYYTAKHVYEHNVALNLYTGEIKNRV